MGAKDGGTESEEIAGTVWDNPIFALPVLAGEHQLRAWLSYSVKCTVAQLPDRCELKPLVAA